ncbi:hypothetical protein SDC9_93948 [bioreactor metagenome]|uniref:Uncharacterized protein n=1 Tax=bioreactor metagenome TaxID=1076179 RepID=A0A645A210_9ZZZZ
MTNIMQQCSDPNALNFISWQSHFRSYTHGIIGDLVAMHIQFMIFHFQ